MPVTAPAADVRILALGDSYTIGEGVPADERWPVRLAGLLGRHGLHVQEPRIIAQTGWTTDELSAGIDAARPSGPFDLVTLLIGVNDQYRGRGVEQYRVELRMLLARATEFAGRRPGRVIVLSIPDWSVTPFAAGRDRAAIARAINVFNAVNREEATSAQARYVDITQISRTADRRPDLVARDGLHPSGAMYTEWGSIVLPVALESLGLHRPPG